MTIPHLGIIGKKGEDLARIFLEEKGLKIIESNARVRGGEIDLIMKDPISSEIVFVEVRTRTFSEFGTPEESITSRKARSLNRSIAMYMQKLPWKTQYRLDLVAITLTGDKTDIQYYHHLELT